MTKRKKDIFGTKSMDKNVGKTHDIFGHRYDDPRFYSTAGFTTRTKRK